MTQIIIFILIELIGIAGAYCIVQNIHKERVGGLLGFIYRNPIVLMLSLIAILLVAAVLLVVPIAIFFMMFPILYIPFLLLSSCVILSMIYFVIPFLICLKLNKNRTINEDKTVTIRSIPNKNRTTFIYVYLAITLMYFGIYFVDSFQVLQTTPPSVAVVEPKDLDKIGSAHRK